MDSALAHILIAEDEGIVAADLQDCLRRAGYQTTIVDNGRAALEKAAALSPSLVLMDILLKGTIDGIEAAKAIRRQFGIPVIFLSAHTDEPTMKRARAAAPSGYIVKPFDEAELNAAVASALTNRSWGLGGGSELRPPSAGENPS